MLSLIWGSANQPKDTVLGADIRAVIRRKKQAPCEVLWKRMRGMVHQPSTGNLAAPAQEPLRIPW
jgi:hypothetical protein